MSSSSFQYHHLQRRVIRIVAVFAVLAAVIGIPLMIFDQQRLDIAHDLGLVPGKDAEKLAEGDEGATLIVVPLGEYSGIGRERYSYRAMYIARPSAKGMTLTDIESGATVDVPLRELDHIAADSDGAHILFRGPWEEEPSADRAVVLDTTTDAVDVLPEGQESPDLPGDWETQTWQKVTGTCDRVSPLHHFIACFNRADAASYLAGDWQIDVQVYGDFEASEPVSRGIGFLPFLGFAHDDTWLYFQNETGIYRIEIPHSLQERQAAATPESATPAP